MDDAEFSRRFREFEAEQMASLPPVTLGSLWLFPDGETWRVGALMVDGTETTALCVLADDDRSVLHIPALSLARQAEPIY